MGVTGTGPTMSNWESSTLSGVLGGITIGTILSVAFAVYRIVNHTACRSTCCGRVATASLDVGASPYVHNEVIQITPPRRLSSDASHVTSPVARAERPQTPVDQTTPQC